MRLLLGLVVLLMPALARGQQGYVPLSRIVDGPYTALLHERDATGHTSIRPFLWEDVRGLQPGDTLAEAAPTAFQRMADPKNRWYGGPLAEMMAGASFNEEDPFKYRAGAGAWLGWNATPKLTFQADAMGWRELLPDYLDGFAHVQKVTPGEGLAERDGQVVAHYDWNGQVDYKAGEFFHFTLGKGRNFLGEGHRSLFLSDEAYSYPYFRITTTAWHIRYVNLFALMRDLPGSRTPLSGPSRKFASMHYLSWNISKRVNAGFFEAIVWQDNDPDYPRGFDLSYLNPVIFLRPVEFGLGSPDNALMGAALNVKVGRRTQLYSQVVLDEFLLGHVRAGDGWYGNKQGVQVGAVSHEAFKVRGLSLRAEVNYARPFMYTHTDRRQNYAHFGQPLAHPYGSGFLEGLAQGKWQRNNWLVENTFSYAVMGRDTSWDANGNNGNNIFLSDSYRPLDEKGKPRVLDFRMGDPVQATVVQNELRVGRLLLPPSMFMLELAWTFRSESAPGFPGSVTNYLRIGLSSNLHGRHPFQTVR